MTPDFPAAWPADDPLAADRFVGALSQDAARRRLAPVRAYLAEGGRHAVRPAPSAWEVAERQGPYVASLRHARTGERVRVAPPGWPVGVVGRSEGRRLLDGGGWAAVRASDGAWVGVSRLADGQVLRLRRRDEEAAQRVEVSLA